MIVVSERKALTNSRPHNLAHSRSNFVTINITSSNDTPKSRIALGRSGRGEGPLELLVLQYKVVQAQEGSLDAVCPWISLNHTIQLLKHFFDCVQSTMFIFI